LYQIFFFKKVLNLSNYLIKIFLVFGKIKKKNVQFTLPRFKILKIQKTKKKKMNNNNKNKIDRQINSSKNNKKK